MEGPRAHEKINYLVLFVLLFCFSIAKAQNPDSLRGVINQYAREDTGKVRLYAFTSRAYRYSSVDSVISFANKGITLANKLHFDNGRADCIVNLGLASLIKFDLDKGLSYCNQAIAIYERQKDSLAMASPLFFIATIYYNQTRYAQAAATYEKAARLYERSGNIQQLAFTYNNIGNSYSALANYPEALNYFLKGLKIREQLKIKADIAGSLGNIGQVYADMGENEKAIAYVKQSIAIQQRDGDPMGTMINYENAGGVYLAVSDYKEAIEAFIIALRVADSAFHGGPQINRILCNLGEAYVESGDYERAYDVYQRCLKDTALADNPSVSGMTHRGMGRILVYKGQLKPGIDHLLQAMSIFKENELPREMTETADELRKAYETANDYSHALQYTNMYYQLRDTIYSEKNNLKVQQLQFDYELQKKQAQIELLNKDKQIAQIRMWGLISGLCLLIIIVVLLFRSRQHEKRTREMIARQAANLDELNKFKDKIFSVLSHDLSGPLNSLSVTMEMLDDNVLSVAEFNELKPEVNKQLKSLTFLLDNLLKWSKNYLTGGKAVKAEPIDLGQIASQNLALVQNVADRKKISIHNNIPAGAVAMADIGHIDIVVRNLVSNALKFTQPGGSITLSARSEGNKIRMSVSDTGVGMTDEQLKKLFTSTPDNSTYGTGGEKGIGLGLLLCYEFIQANNGTITATSTPGQGSTFIIELPAA